MSGPDALIDISTRHQVYLEGLKGAQRKKAAEFLRKLEKDIRRRFPSDIQSLTRARFLKLLAKTDRMTKDQVSEYIGRLIDDVIEFAQYEGTFSGGLLSEMIPDMVFNAPTTAQLNAAVFATPMSVSTPYSENLMKPFIRSLRPRAQTSITNAIRIGYYAGDSTQAIVERLRSTISGPIQNDLNTIVRTALQHTAGTVRSQVAEANSDIVDGYVWISVLDGKTSQICRSLDTIYGPGGEVIPLDSGPREPMHLNCRSGRIPHFKKEFDYLNDPGTRISRDMTDKRKTKRVKTVDGKLDYYTWLKNQPASVQKDILKGKRYKLFRDSGLSPEAFARLQIGTNFEPMTLKQMAKRDARSFKRAQIDISKL